MSNFEDPIQFDEFKKIGNVEVSFSNMMEVSQGGPVAGDISINGNKIPGRFGGPILIEGKYLYLPALVKRILGTGFKLARINLNTLETEHLGKTRFFIYLDKIENNRVYFFEDMEKTIKSYFDL